VISISNWIMIMHRVVASGFNWNETHENYKNGFGSSDSEDFWLGLLLRNCTVPLLIFIRGGTEELRWVRRYF